jgi:hypothetical protein
MTKAASGPNKIHAALKKLKNESNAKELEFVELVASVYESVKEKKEQAVDKIKNTASTIDTSVDFRIPCRTFPAKS